MNIRNLSDLTPAEREQLLHRSGETVDGLSAKVASIMQEVKHYGDAALKKFTQQFDRVQLNNLRVTPEEIEVAYQQVPESFIKAFKQALQHRQAFEQHLFQPEEQIQLTPGIQLWREWRPIPSVGLYIPGGRANYPSSLLMTAVPAKIAGCPQFVVCTPPNEEGSAPASTLVACDLVGVKEIYKIGGAQAIAALTHGTESVPQVYKIFGAGNAFVTEAKLQAFGQVDIDAPAGPSEIMILADQSANPVFLAADLISQAEHGPDSSCLLITDSKELAQQVAAEVEKQVTTISTQNTIKESLANFGCALVVEQFQDGINFANDYAPEHLEIVTKNDDHWLEKITNVGSVFLGSYAPVSAGDYASGTNHVLPTNGYAKMFNPLSVESFAKKIQVQRLSKEGLATIQKSIGELAHAEGLPAHSHAVDIRFTGETTT